MPKAISQTCFDELYHKLYHRFAYINKEYKKLYHRFALMNKNYSELIIYIYNYITDLL